MLTVLGVDEFVPSRRHFWSRLKTLLKHTTCRYSPMPIQRVDIVQKKNKAPDRIWVEFGKCSCPLRSVKLLRWNYRDGYGLHIK